MEPEPGSSGYSQVWKSLIFWAYVHNSNSQYTKAITVYVCLLSDCNFEYISLIKN